jgi:hypothetical protein
MLGKKKKNPYWGHTTVLPFNICRPFGWGWREAVCSWTALWGCTVASLLVSDKTQVDERILLAPPAVAKL